MPFLYAPPETAESDREFVGPAVSTLALLDAADAPWFPTLSDRSSRYS